MNVEIVTREDLNQFRLLLLEDLKSLMAPAVNGDHKKWLRSKEVRALLKISPGTLQNLRITGKLHPSKIGGIFYYRQEEIQLLLHNNPT
jgi:hypothetical protein